MKAANWSPMIGAISIAATTSATITSVDDDQRRNAAADAQPLGPPRDRIEQIGQRHAGHERQQHVAEQPEHRDEHRERRDPERDLPLQSSSPRHPAAAPGAPRHQAPASAEFMWRTHSAR